MFIALVKQCFTINNVETVETKLNVPWLSNGRSDEQ